VKGFENVAFCGLIRRLGAVRGAADWAGGEAVVWFIHVLLVREIRRD
jgi:hypothetical protein